MKVIFLDIDGVLINRESCRQGFGIPDLTCVQHLNYILDNSDAQLVISSCWRIGRSVPELQKLLEEWGVRRNRIIDKTPHDWSAQRGQEIQWWLEDNKGVERFVIVDDDSDMCHLLPYLVKTRFEPGLTLEDAKKVLDMLLNGLPSE